MSNRIKNRLLVVGSWLLVERKDKTNNQQLVTSNQKGFTPLEIFTNKRRSLTGFTFIELLITLSIVAITFLPLMNMFTESILQADSINDLTVARYLAQEGMEKMINLNYTAGQLRAQGDIWDPPLEEPATDFNGRKWRTLRKLITPSEPLEVHIQVFRVIDENRENIKVPSLDLNQNKPVVELITLYEVFALDADI